MTFGLNASQLHLMQVMIVNPLKELGCKVWLFGSRARGDFTPYSDVDIMVESQKDMMREISIIREKMSNSNFPFKIDIVAYSDFAEAYKSSFEKDKILL